MVYDFDVVPVQEPDIGKFIGTTPAQGGQPGKHRTARSLGIPVEEVGHEVLVAPVEAAFDPERRLCEAVGRARCGVRRRR